MALTVDDELVRRAVTIGFGNGGLTGAERPGNEERPDRIWNIRATNSVTCPELKPVVES